MLVDVSHKEKDLGLGLWVVFHKARWEKILLEIKVKLLHTLLI
jgi:hypothetical protein